MTDLTNALADMAERVKTEIEAEAVVARISSVHALTAGAILCEAREVAEYGHWRPFLERAGIHERQARRLMQLSRSGLDAETIAAIGGMKAALAWLSSRRLPEDDQGLFITLGDDPDLNPMAVVSRWAGGFRVIRIAPDHELTEFRKPVAANEDAVWQVVDSLLDSRRAEMSFELMQNHAVWEASMDLLKRPEASYG